MKWKDVREKIGTITDHYSMREDQHELLYNYAMKVPKNGVVLEIGVCNGKTAALFALVGKEKGYKYYGIDNFSLEGTKADVDGHLQRLGVKGEIIETDSRTYDWKLPIDLLFIDGGHDEANISVDCEKYIPFVKKGGIVIFDDWALDETRANPHWAVGHYGTIATEGWEDICNEIYIRAFRRPE
jgi:predicted O-methyltransferase YrrM